MNYVIIILSILVFFGITFKWIAYLAATRGKKHYAKHRIFFLLFLAFMSLISISTIFADAAFKYFGYEKPVNIEWLGLIAFAILAYAAIRIMESGNKKSTKIEQHNQAGDNTTYKADGDIHFHNGATPQAETEICKELTLVNRINPDDLIGRDNDIKDLNELLFNNKKVVVVNGLGGIGKTTLAEAYVFKYYQDYKHILWITHNKDLMDDFVQNTDLIKNLRIPITSINIREIFQEIMRQLRNLKGQPNLLIIDNANTEIEHYLKDLPGQPNWHLLLTSRVMIAGLHTKELDFLKPDEAIKLFQKHCQIIGNSQDIDKIVKAVEYHTLSIEILAKTAQRRGIDSAQLQTAIDNDLKANIKTSHSQLDKIDKITSYLCSIFDLSSLNKREMWLMQQFSCLPAEFINAELLHMLLLEKSNDKADDLHESLTELKEKGWLLNDHATNSYRMHRIITAVISAKHPVKTDDINHLIKQVSQLLNIDQTKDNPVDKFKWVPYGLVILKALPENTEALISKLQNNLALVLQDLGDFKAAKGLLEKALTSAEKNFGEGHPTTAVRYSNLALVLRKLGDINQALPLARKALKVFIQSYPEGHPYIIQTQEAVKIYQQEYANKKN